MKVEIWSDIVCPYCYMGKRKFENALKKFPKASEIEVSWHSYQLDPSLEHGNKTNFYQYMADLEGVSYNEAVASQKALEKQAFETTGLVYNFDKAIITNTRDAHRLIHLAKKYQLDSDAEEQLFQAYFTDGKDISDYQTLLQIGKVIGLNENEINRVLNSNELADEVDADIKEAEKLNLYYVPFFLFDKKYIVTGIVTEENFLEVLNKAFFETSEERETSASNNLFEGQSCGLDGTCS